MGRRLGAIALLAMFVRAIVPAGYMLAPAYAADSRYVTVTQCGEHGGGQRVLDLKTGKLVDPAKLPGKREHRDHSPCVCAVASTMAPPQEAASPEVNLVAYDSAPAIRTDLDFDAGVAAPRPFSTGPPFFL